MHVAFVRSYREALLNVAVNLLWGQTGSLIDLRVWCPCPINVSLPPLS